MAPALSPVVRRHLVVVVMAVALALLLATPTFARNILGIGVTTVLTGSMRPAIDPGDLVITSMSAASSISVGDVVVVNSGDVPIAHRVVEVRLISGLNRLTTKGDANALIDTDPIMVSANRDVPRVIWRVPAVGSTLAFLASPQAQRLGLTLLVGANLLALALFALRRRPTEGEGDRPEGPQPTRTDLESVNA